MPAKKATTISPQKKGKIHNEYITTDCSLRYLAKKHKVAFSTISKWCREEFWTQDRQQLKNAVEEETKNNSGTDIEQYKKLMAERASRIYSSADRLLDKINMLLDLDEPLCPKDLKSISSTLLDLKLIHNIKDESEQDTDKVIRVVFDDWEDS